MNTGKAVLAVLGGVAVGALVGVLFAPDKGTKTRKKILDKGKDYVGDLKGKVGDLKGKFEDLYDDANKKYEKVVSKYDHVMADGRDIVSKETK